MQTIGRYFVALVGLAATATGSLRAEDAVDYERQIKPIFRERCYACHGGLEQKAELRLDTVKSALVGGESGAAIVASKADESPLLERVTSTDEAERMPPEGERLTAEQIALLKAWISQGAKAPADETPERDPRDHWAFKTPVRSAVPVTDSAAWNRNPIDAFLHAERGKHGLQPQPRADKRLWLRRVSLDLIGLPPTPAEQEAFLADTSPQAYETVTTRLLDSPQYGERWGRHWMDVWRYSDAWGLGADLRNSQKHLWHWRDWIVESLNQDKGYDQMLREMLAADELYPNDLDRLRGGGFLARQYFKFNRTTWMDETVEHTSKAMLGLTFNCCKCHDHKYDPIRHEDYYRLRAVFEPYQVRMDQLPGELNLEMNGLPRPFDCHLDAPTYLHVRGDDRNPDQSRALEPAIPAFLSRAKWTITPVTLPAEAAQPGLRSFVIADHLRAAEQKIAQASTALEAAKVALATAEKAEQVASAPTVEKPTTEPAALVTEDFAKEQPQRWEIKDGKWTYADGKLVQSADGAMRGILELKEASPENFEAQVQLRITGGQMWKSVGIAFDADGKQDCMAYVSAYAGGPKAQIAYKTTADYVYPPEGFANHKIELNQPCKLTLRVRGTLMNVLVNDELLIAYKLPIARRAGKLQLITYDATAEFLKFELRKLPDDSALVEAKGGAASKTALPGVAEAKLALTLAEKALATATAQPASIRARAAAEAARHQQPAPADAVDLARAAAKGERELAVAQAEEEAAKLELELVRTPADKKSESEKKLVASRTAIEAAKKALDAPGETFTALRGALKTLESSVETDEQRQQPFPATSTGRRTALAQWITDQRNPLTARVAVNHVWLRHFGKPLVPTVFDFGRKGTPPTHPELLDWLAVEFMEHGWSMKHLHRLIVTSETYRLASTSAGAPAETLARDAENRYYWRANSVRMEAQAVRDALLHLAGELDLTMGGPPLAANDEQSRRRSLYFTHSHNEHHKFLAMFDDANVLDCYRRSESIVPQQALALENSPLATSLAEKIARRIVGSAPNASDGDFVRAAFVAVLAVEPTAEEQAVAVAGLARLTELARAQGRPQPAASARSGLIHALLNHNDFITIR
jgi:mono/diheme cytochrome c family protein